MAVSGSAGERPPAQADILELLVKVGALVAVVLPIVGAGVRATAFALAGIPNPLELAVAEPVSKLVTTALVAAAPVAAAIAALAPFVYRDWPRPNAPLRNYALASRGSHFLIALGFLLLAIAVFILPFPAGLIWTLSCGALSYQLGFWSARRELTFYRVASVVFLAAITTALAAGLNGIGIGDAVYEYQFSPSSGVPDGTYALLGQSDGVVYLDPCKTSGIEGVSQQVIVKFKPASAHRETLDSPYEIFFSGGFLQIGYRRQC
jgi:hypothetical protein